MDVLLRLLDLTGVFVGLREGVYQTSQYEFTDFKIDKIRRWAEDEPDEIRSPCCGVCW
jgi:hypothetical protein